MAVLNITQDAVDGASPLLSAALEYAARGWQVFPLHGIVGGRCTCSDAACESIGKHPRTAHGVSDATVDETTIRKWWTWWPEANVGIATGKCSGFVVIDIDPGRGGSTGALEDSHGPLPETLVACTGGGGRHILFSHPGPKVRNRVDLLPGIDVRGDGGYIVAAPSRHVRGELYRWEFDHPVAPLPDWLCEMLKPKVRTLVPLEPRPHDEATRHWAGAALEDEIHRVASAGEGTRNHTLNKAAFSLGQIVGSRLLDRDRVERELMHAAEICGLSEHEAERTIASGLEAGIQEPRGPEQRVASTRAPITVETATRASAGAAQSPDAPAPTSWAAAQDVHDFVNTVEPEADFLEPKQIMRGAVTDWSSPRGIGKTLVAHAIAVKQAHQGRRVLLIDRDNPRREVRRRLRAWGLAGLERGRLKVISREDAPPLTDDEKWREFPVGEYDLVILDSFGSASEGVGDQDSDKASLAVATLLDVVRATKGPAALVLDNTTKSGAHGRGSGVIEDRLDIVFEVRDATGFRPTGTKDWWLELPAAGRDAWGDRASRRKRRDTYRLAFVPSKFRVGEEPDPFVLEVSCVSVPWTCTDVTHALVEEGEQAKAEAASAEAAKLEKAAAALKTVVATRHTAESPMRKGEEAERFLMDLELTRKAARALIVERTGRDWWVAGTGRSGDPEVLLPEGGLSPTTTARPHGKPQAPEPRSGSDPGLAARDPRTRRDSTPPGAASDAVAVDHGVSPPQPNNTGAETEGTVAAEDPVTVLEKSDDTAVGDLAATLGVPAGVAKALLRSWEPMDGKVVSPFEAEDLAERERNVPGNLPEPATLESPGPGRSVEKRP